MKNEIIIKLQMWNIYWKSDKGRLYFVGKAVNRKEITMLIGIAEESLQELIQQGTPRNKWGSYWRRQGKRPHDYIREHRENAETYGEFVAMPLEYEVKI